jgi:hypothetical protein
VQTQDGLTDFRSALSSHWCRNGRFLNRHGDVQSPTADAGRGGTQAHRFDMQRYAAKQQYIIYLISNMYTASWQPYVKNYALHFTQDYGGRAATLWLDR